jgi:hypothetical protein
MGEELSQLVDGPSQGQGSGATVASTVSTVHVDVAADERAARRSLRGQIARLEGELADAFVTAFSIGGLPQPPVPASAEPRLLDLGELEIVRDELAQRLHAARKTITRRADEQAEKRLLLERMLLQPGRYRFTRVSCHDLGEPGCGVWQVRPRLGLIGMLMGWWQVKLSSGCPLAGGCRSASGPATLIRKPRQAPACARC